MVKWCRAFVFGAAMLATSGTVAPPAAAMEARDEARVFFFGNSLLHHLTDSSITTVPYWLGLLAREGGKSFAADGRWGFPRNFIEELPPTPNWVFDGVQTVAQPWDPIHPEDFDTYVFAMENYVQGRAPELPYQGDNPGQQSPMGATLTLIDWVRKDSDGARFMVYEGWADLNALAKTFPPDEATLAKYHEVSEGEYHDWFVSFVDRLKAERPDQEIDLIPVAPVMVQALSMPELAGLPAKAFYADLSPHGTATTYLLAAMITYSAFYGERPPEGFEVPDVIDPVFAKNYEAVAETVWRALQEADAD